MTEHDGTLGRVATVEGAEFQAVGERVYIGDDRSKRTVVERLLGVAKLERLSPAAQEQLPLAMAELVKANAAHFLKGFYNVAGPINRKTHAFQLLNGVGPKKPKKWSRHDAQTADSPLSKPSTTPVASTVLARWHIASQRRSLTGTSNHGLSRCSCR